MQTPDSVVEHRLWVQVTGAILGSVILNKKHTRKNELSSQLFDSWQYTVSTDLSANQQLFMQGVMGEISRQCHTKETKKEEKRQKTR